MPSAGVAGFFGQAATGAAEILQPLQRASDSLLVCSSVPCGITGETATELNFYTCVATSSVMQRNFITARAVVRQAFSDLEAQCLEEKAQYEKVGLVPSAQKNNWWAFYLDKERVRECMTSSMDFVRSHPECRSRLLPDVQLRFLVLLQHFVAEDTTDFSRPMTERKHCDAFEGLLTEDGVNSQLIKDAHRSEWSIEGHSFTLQPQLTADTHQTGADRKRVIVAFQHDLVTAIETHLLDFCRRRGLSVAGTRRLLQAVTTQMSQCGLANLDRSSQAARYFVSWQGLEQRTAYNLSTMDAGHLGEALKLSMLCMKTGFRQYHTEETLGAPGSPDPEPKHAGPVSCAPSSYLYQYATLRFVPGPPAGGCERPMCVVIDALDEVHINPPPPDPDA